MQLYEILVEKIVVQPINPKLFFGNRAKRLTAISAAVAQAVVAIKRNDGEGDYVLGYALRHLLPENSYPLLPDAYAVDLNQQYCLERLQTNLESIVKFGPRDFLGYAISTLDDIHPLNAETRNSLTLMPHVEAGLREYGFDPVTHADDPEYRSARALADAYVVIWNALRVVETLIAELRPVLADMKQRRSLQYEPEKYRPTHDAVETLYHASMFASEIVRNGFAAERPADRRGLGFSYGQETISFTHQLKIAHDIMRCLKEMWMIVHGQITRRKILGWIAAEGLDLAQLWDTYGTRDQPVDSIVQLIRLYQGYISYSKLRTNPVFMAPTKLIAPLRQCAIDDIGIVSCLVRLDGTEEYLHGEGEFRVPASRVIGAIKRVV